MCIGGYDFEERVLCMVVCLDSRARALARTLCQFVHIQCKQWSKCILLLKCIEFKLKLTEEGEKRPRSARLYVVYISGLFHPHGHRPHATYECGVLDFFRRHVFESVKQYFISTLNSHKYTEACILRSHYMVYDVCCVVIATNQHPKRKKISS